MKTKLNGSSYSLLALMVIMVLVFVQSIIMPQFQSKMLPLTYSVLIFILAAATLIKDLTAKNEVSKIAKEGKKHGSEEADEGWRGYFFVSIWIVGFFLAIYFLGFILAIPLFLGFYMKRHGVRWLAVVLFVLITPIFIYFVFEYLLGTELFRGLLFNMLGYE